MSKPPSLLSPEELAAIPPELWDDPVFVQLREMSAEQDAIYRGLSARDAKDDGEQPAPAPKARDVQ